MNRILCPVDFSESSLHGLAVARATARSFGARITLVYVHPLAPAVVGAGPAVTMSPPTILTEEERQSLMITMRSLAVVDGDAAGGVDTVVVEDVNVAAGIRQQADEMRADLIVIGTQGRSRLERFGLGSVAEALLRKARCPVLSVAPHAATAPPSGPLPLQHILCAVDFSPNAMNALPRALEWAAAAGGRLTALHVAEISPEFGEPPSPEFEAYRDHVVNDARRRLADAVRDAAPRVPVEQRIAAGRPAHEIIRFAADHQVDLIVMGVRGRSPLDLAFFGSTTNRVVRQASCPVLSVHSA